MAKRKKVRLPRILNDMEIDAMRKTFPSHCMTGKRDLLLFDTLISTGMRISEALALRYRDLEQGNGNTTFYHLRNSKNGEEAHIYIPQHIIEQIKELKVLFKHTPSNYVFTAVRDGNKALLQSYYRRKIKEIAIEAGVNNPEEVHTHNTRATFATKILAETNDIYLVSTLLRHKNISTTAIYAKLNPMKGVDTINRLFN